MPAKIIDGKKLAEEMLKEIKKNVSLMKLKPGLAAVLVGDDPASAIYIKNKKNKCEEAGFYSEVHHLKANIDELDLLKLIDRLNQDKKIHGMIVQLPLPKHINEKLVINYVVPHKDADGFNSINLGNLLAGNNSIIPATPKGIMKLLESIDVKFEGKNAVVIGRSTTVGKPIALLLQQKNCTVTMCHSRTVDLAKYTKNADILVVAVGKPKLINGSMVKKDAIVIDVGINRVNGKVVGDVDLESVRKVASYISPVPGGVGPMTVVMLLENTLECMKLGEKV